MIMCAAAIVGSGVYFCKVSRRYGQRMERLMCQTDFQVLLAACRELSTRVTTKTLEPGYYWIHTDREPRVPDLPKIILDIEPVGLYVSSEGWVMREMGGIPSYGVVAYPGASKAGHSFHGDVELIPGLWYYDEDYSTGEFPKHQKRIDALVQKGKMIQAQRNRSKDN